MSANQCDGCARGLEVLNGLHVDKHGRADMACTKDRYEQEQIMTDNRKMLTREVLERWKRQGVYDKQTMIPICIGCNKRPEEIEEYVEIAKDAGTTPNDYVREDEGTYNHENGHFTCTECYVRMGMPSSPRGWVAP